MHHTFYIQKYISKTCEGLDVQSGSIFDRLEPNQKSMIDHNQDNILTFDYKDQGRL